MVARSIGSPAALCAHASTGSPSPPPPPPPHINGPHSPPTCTCSARPLGHRRLAGSYINVNGCKRPAQHEADKQARAKRPNNDPVRATASVAHWQVFISLVRKSLARSSRTPSEWARATSGRADDYAHRPRLESDRRMEWGRARVESSRRGRGFVSAGRARVRELTARPCQANAIELVVVVAVAVDFGTAIDTKLAL